MTTHTASYATAPRAHGTIRPEPHLVVALECQSPEAGASRHSLEGIGLVALGRGPQRHVSRREGRLDIRLPDSRMSTSHARIECRGGEHFLIDEGSKNGVFQNGYRQSEAVLQDGDLLLLGETLLLFESSLEAYGEDSPDRSVRAPGPFTTMIPTLERSFETLAQVATATLPVLLQGATGTGKELTARAIHQLSGRKGEFVAMNCGALPPSLLESSLFGHTRGAFSGATQSEPGFVLRSDGGTLLIDEVGDLPLPAQAALLRVLQEGEVIPVGSSRTLPVALRVIAATHRDLEKMVRVGAFRDDLYARLAAFVFRLPALEERRLDVGLITGGILARLGKERGRSFTLSPEAGTALLTYSFPRNVRELEKSLERAAVIGTTGRIDARELGLPSRPDDGDDLRARVVALLGEHRGNLAAVAKAMATSRTQVHRWLERYSLDANAFRRSR